MEPHVEPALLFVCEALWFGEPYTLLLGGPHLDRLIDGWDVSQWSPRYLVGVGWRWGVCVGGGMKGFVQRVLLSGDLCGQNRAGVVMQ
jgi:hypothetical protein